MRARLSAIISLAGVDIGSSGGSGGSSEGGGKIFWLDPIPGQKTAYISMAPYTRTSGFGP